MGLRFRKSKKIGKGTRLNLGKKSAGISFGGRAAGISFNSKTGARARVSVPGTGISYSTKIGGSSKRKGASTSNAVGGSGSCLVTCLKIFGVLIAIPFVALFGWLYGIYWLIVKRKQLNDEPEKQKKNTILVSILSLFSLIIMILVIANPSNSEPSDTQPSSETVISTEANTEDNTKIETESEEIISTETETTENTEVESNESEQQESEISSDEQSESTDAHVEETPVVEEPAAEQQVSEQTQETVTQSETQQEQVYVWIDATGKKYHSKSTCSNMSDPYQVTKEQAEAEGRDACKKCYR